ncbi:MULTISPECIES: amidohydrolase family protein [unclassified Mesorhizobium]|uniref:amidohydrolase family protein n=1 Tax=unclassified Mesorhizobium TaxID=325217 RepID=UPI00086A4034|nr:MULTISPECIES: amidohydrolase family protein [unclassified Mesorhizobium]MBN9257814.1 amidohydrolase family protein [Mesorhizobium sp.]ODT18287.1 MAG: Enamidase [Mesorhizobium sp. SCN 65-12]OJX79244.1 MAG: Enamidase [Mesorhizobium sp. 65-26]
MSSEPQAKPAAGKTVIRNVGLMLSGDIGRPILDADTIVVVDGLIAAVGKESELDTAGATKVIDAQGCVVTPGLIDNHVHTAAGDWTPRQNQIGWIDSTVHGGVTTIISAGEAHYPGRPRDIVGIKALGIAAQRSFANFRPSGMKIIAGAPVLEPGMTENDFRELAEAGVTLIGEVGLGGVKDGPTGRQMIAWARKYGMTSMTHTGGPSIPGSGRIGAEVVLEVDADVVAHVNGGPTALPDDEIRRICEEGTRALEIVHNGNLRTGLFVLGIAKERNELDRVILGTDGPAGSGVQPLGILRTICHLASLGDVPTEVVFCFATGNTARVRKLADRGVIEAGRAADLIFMDQAAGGIGKDFLESLALGNLPGIGMIMIDGEVRTARSRNTPPAIRVPEIVAA